MSPLANNPAELALALSRAATPWLIVWFLFTAAAIGGLVWWFRDPLKRDDARETSQILSGILATSLILGIVMTIAIHVPYGIASWKARRSTSPPPRVAYQSASRPNAVAGLEGDPLPLLAVLAIAVVMLARGNDFEIYYEKYNMVLGGLLLVALSAEGLILIDAWRLSHIKLG